ncbi:MAG TPA: MFS transporter [Symbiobacteriaceae bacterium]|nr:MFS transporter [Symbiobacteriaceae bacterium]
MGTVLLLIIYLAFISLGLPDSLLGAAWPVMRPDLGAPLGTAGLLSLTVSVGTILSSLASGAVIERFGTGRVTLISCLMTATALLGYSYAPSVAWLIICAIPLGLGAGSVDAALNHYVATHYKAHHMSWLHSFWGVGATTGPVIMAAFLSRDGDWRHGYLTVALIQFSLVVLLFVTLRLWDRQAATESADSPTVQPEAEAAVQNGGSRTANGLTYALGSFLFYCGVELTVGLWGSSYLVNVKGLLVGDAARWVSLYYAGITIGRFVTGFATFKVSNRHLIRAGQMTALAGTLLLLLPLPTGFALAGFLITGLGLAPIYPSMLHETPVRFGEKHAQRIMGYQMAVAYVGSTLMPPLLGLLAGFWSIGLFPLYVALSAAAMLLCTEWLNVILAGSSRPRRFRPGHGPSRS